MSTITVLLADDHAIVREGLRAFLNREDDIEVVGEAENGRRAVTLVGKLCPDVVVMDLSMPLLNGMEATRQVRQTSPSTKVLVLSAHSDDAYVEQVMAFGAAGYLNKQTSVHELPAAIREVHQGRPFYSPIISKRLSAHDAKARARSEFARKKAALLKSREMEVLQLIAEGKANKESAAELQISTKTIEKHRQSLMHKLNIHNTAGLTRYAVAAGIVESSVQVTIL
ncbi:response regulator transcription factor [Prosthecobacter sp.]|uniref:response regulator transcription factor n=1 Tax=Prosthecobacter sp. TaxID=1965333 RepID=UPI002AB97EA4|nr:response regulator transcription factor [Prosthecobacter sp.]MDZ4403612.1 response regulator transcription factor [Prosthecobacter sp.]